MSYDVVIVGGGPVGLGSAIALAQQGIRCLVVERYQQPSPIPRGQNLTQRTMEHFHFWGIEKALRNARTIPAEYGMGGLTAYGTLLGQYHYDWMRRELVKPFYYTENERIPQYVTEAILRQRAKEFPEIETMFGWGATDLVQDETGVTVTIAPRNGEGSRKIRATYCIGADGSRSLVRTKAGITQTLSDHDRLMVLLVFRSAELHQLLARYPGKSFYNVLHPDLKGYWRFLGRVDLGTTWFFHAPVPMGTTADNFDFKDLVQTSIGAEFELIIDHIGFWDLRFAIADNYGSGRIFIAGDAAHSHPPYGGYGINTGFEDATNLAWKIAAALKGWAGPELLASYNAERHPIFASTAADFIAKFIENDRDFLASHDPTVDKAAFEAGWSARANGATGEVHAFEPHYEGSPIVDGGAGAETSVRGSHRHEARAGHHLSPVALADNINIYERLDGGFTLLTFEASERILETFASAARSLNLPLQILREAKGEAHDKLAADMVLIRPDQFIAWVAHKDASTIDSLAILRKACGYLNAS